ncbi:serpin B9-like isoform X2 [Apodemus sylvaticus]|uniref:serpin B9-like isoform X2 n=1 Tax=Apodemus sylvaticus TaxID=10129 RepID=UPI00224422E4|nr:serpin B9-like isoform X2 [Apodemus sylvaticus]
MNTLSESNGTFAINLLKMLCQNNPSENVLGLSPEEDIHHSFQLLLHNLNKPNRKYSLRMANRLFAENTYQLLPTFKASCLQFYHSEIEQLSFAEATEESRRHINTWVSKQTEGKILELLPDDSVDSETRLVLVNALYFKGKWHQPFYSECTREMPFKVNKREKRPVEMMCQTNTFNFICVKEIQAKLLVMPYEGVELNFIVLLPDDGVDLSKVENNLTFEKLTAWTKPDFMKTTDVEVFLPKFKLEEKYDMAPLFEHLGMVDVFHGGKADLSGISQEKGLWVSRIIHKCVVEGNEEGTVAAAASADDIVDYCDSDDSETYETFCADHPFLFFIQHKDTNSILFCGRFSSP